jgi:UDP-glucose 4-epimerase
MSAKVLVTGGAGYIGSHTAVQLLQSGFSVVIVDNLCNSKRETIGLIEKISGNKTTFIEGDIRDRSLVSDIFLNYKIDAVIHFAGLKAVGESQSNPLKYYDNNVVGSLVLFEAMQTAGCKRLIFSSSATVYGNAETQCYKENLALLPINVYGKTKLVIEDMLRNIKAADHEWRIGVLRYFNPVGAHESGLLGEDPRGVPNNLMPIIAQVAAGQRSAVEIFGQDYPTHDGTGLRDYIHVDDLARGHLAALEWLERNDEILTVNLGTGRPYSVLELIKSFSKVSGVNIPYKFVSRRPGDLPAYYADPSLAKKLLRWSAHFDLERMCKDVWRWTRYTKNILN